MSARTPIVAVAGRPNVGKSSLVNRIVGRRAAIVEETPGVTRDRHVLAASWVGRTFDVVDTGGWTAVGAQLAQQVSDQASRAMAEADLVLLVVDATVGVTLEDEAVADHVRRLGRPVLVVANKVDSAQREPDAWEAARLGLGDPWPISALHGRSVGDLLDEVVRQLPEEPVPDDTPPEPYPGAPDSAAAEAGDGSAAEVGSAGTGPPPIGAVRTGSPPIGPVRPGRAGERPAEGSAKVPGVAVVGRPNVGKSTLFNRLVGEERSVTHDLPGTTTDAVDTVVETPEGAIRFVDTAGLRRRSRIGEGTEYYSLVRALQAIDAADVALLVIDASEGVTHQDQRLAERIDASGSPVVILANKWELLDAEQRAMFREDVADRLGFLSYAPMITISARTGLRVDRILPAVARSLEAYGRRVPTRELNEVVQAAQRSQPAPGARVLYATQGTTDPPTITLFATRKLPATWLRYLERKVREHFAMGPTPIEIRVRRRDESPSHHARRTAR